METNPSLRLQTESACPVAKVALDSCEILPMLFGMFLTSCRIGPWQDQTPSLPFSRDAFETVLDHCSIPPTFLTSCFKTHYCVSTARTKLESDGIMCKLTGSTNPSHFLMR